MLLPIMLSVSFPLVSSMSASAPAGFLPRVLLLVPCSFDCMDTNSDHFCLERFPQDDVHGARESLPGLESHKVVLELYRDVPVVDLVFTFTSVGFHAFLPKIF